MIDTLYVPKGLEQYQDDKLLAAHDSLQSLTAEDLVAPDAINVQTVHGSVRKHELYPKGDLDDSRVIVRILPMANIATPQHIAGDHALQGLVGPHKVITIPQNNARVHTMTDAKTVASGDFTPLTEQYMWALQKEITNGTPLVIVGGSLGATMGASLANVLTRSNYGNIEGLALAEPVNVTKRSLGKLASDFLSSMPLDQIIHNANTADIPALTEYWQGYGAREIIATNGRNVRVANAVISLGLTKDSFSDDVTAGAASLRGGNVVIHKDYTSKVVPQEGFDAAIAAIDAQGIPLSVLRTHEGTHGVIDNPWLLATMARLAVKTV